MDQGNKALRLLDEQHQYVIVAKRDGVDKYVARGYWERYAFQYTVKLAGAMRFHDVGPAVKFMEEAARAEAPIEGARIVPIIVTTRVSKEDLA